MLPRANEAARARSIIAARGIGRGRRQLSATASRAASALLSSPHCPAAYSSAPSKHAAADFITMDKHTSPSPAAKVGSTTGQRPPAVSPKNAGLWNPSKGILFATAAATASSGPSVPQPALLPANTTQKFKRRRKVDQSIQSPLPSVPFSNVNHFQTSSRNTSSMKDEEDDDAERDSTSLDAKEDDDPFADISNVPPRIKTTYAYTEKYSSPDRVVREDEMTSVQKEKFGSTQSLEAYYGTQTEEGRLDIDLEPPEYSEKAWQQAQDNKRVWERKTQSTAQGGLRARGIEELLMPEGKVNYWDVISPFDKAVKMYRTQGKYGIAYKDIAMCKHKRDARVADIDKVQITMLQNKPDTRFLEEYFNLRATTFEVFIAYSLAGPLELRKLYELVMVEKKLMKATSTMLREIINKRWLRDEEILGFGTRVNIVGHNRLPLNYALTQADTEVVNQAFGKENPDCYYAKNAKNPWESSDEPPSIFVPPVKYPDVADIGDEKAGGKSTGDPRTRLQKRRIQRAIFWAHRYQDLAWRAQRLRLSKEPGGGKSWSKSKKAFTMDDVDDVMRRKNLKPTGEYTTEDVLTKSIENTRWIGKQWWDAEKRDWVPTAPAQLRKEDARRLPDLNEVIPSPEYLAEQGAGATKQGGNDLAEDLRRGLEALDDIESSGVDLEDSEIGDEIDRAYSEMEEEDVWSENEQDDIDFSDTEEFDGKTNKSEPSAEKTKKAAKASAKVLAKSEPTDEELPAEEHEVIEIESSEEEEIEELVEVKAPKKVQAASSKLADEHEREYTAPTYFLDAALVAKSTSSAGKGANNASSITANFSYQLYSKSLPSGTVSSPPAIRYCSTVAQMDNAMKLFDGCDVLGFDMEWGSFRASTDAKYNVSLIQLASYDAIVLFHLAKMDKYDFPSRLKAALEDGSITKIGVAIKGDATRLLKHWNVRSDGLLDLSTYHKLLEDGTENEIKRPSLASLSEFYLKLGLSKDPRVRRSAWNKTLSAEQRLYAANDAYASIRVFDAMERQRHDTEPRLARPDCFQTPLATGTGTGTKPRRNGKSAEDKEIEEEVLGAISGKADPLAALKEHQEKEAGKLKNLVEECSAEDSDDSFERLPTPEDSSASDVERSIAKPSLRKAEFKKTSIGANLIASKRTVINEVSGRREFSTSASTSKDFRSAYLREKTKKWRFTVGDDSVHVNEERQKKTGLVVGHPELMKTARLATVDLRGNKFFRTDPDTLRYSPPPTRSSECKYEEDPKPIKLIGPHQQWPPKNAKYQLKAISKEPGHEVPNNGPLVKALKKEVKRRSYPPEWRVAQRWASFVINSEMVPRALRSKGNPGGSGNQLAFYHLWHIQGFSIPTVQELCSAYVEISEEKTHERICQAISLFPVEYDPVRLKEEILDRATHRFKQTTFYLDALKRYMKDLAGKKREENPDHILKAVTTIDKDYQFSDKIVERPVEEVAEKIKYLHT